MFEASVPVFVTVDGSRLSAWGELPYDLQGEARVRHVVLHLDAAAVTAGDTIPGTLVWTESPSDPPWIDALLQASVQVELLQGSGGLLTVDFEGGVLFGFDTRAGAGMVEVRRSLTLDGRTWGPGFGITLTRTYSTSPDGAAECTATFSGELTPW